VGYMQWQRQRAADAQLATLSTAAKQLCESGDHALAWKRYDDVIAQFPARPMIRAAREDCAMRWLRNIRVREGQETFTDVVNRVMPALAEGAASASGQRAADLQAHMGWADYLRIRDGAGGLNPVQHYEKALADEPTNVYAHTMWAHLMWVDNNSADDAAKHFDAALATGRERAYVRDMQVAAMLYHLGGAGQIALTRVANDMHKNNEPVDSEMRERLWTYVYDDGMNRTHDRRVKFMAAMSDPENLATFQWLFPEAQIRADRKNAWRYCVATLEEAAGQNQAARAHYESLRDDLMRQHWAGDMLSESVAAIKRLNGVA